ncbi:hypothetical protein [Candidatus Vondammii sp. HM_W22]|nr:hypothetical protein [Candidatus Vondammii sp. HM_W22]
MKTPRFSPFTKKERGGKREAENNQQRTDCAKQHQREVERLTQWPGGYA